MRYFSELSEDLNNRIFYRKTEDIHGNNLPYALGALLYIPATLSKHTFEKLLQGKYSHVKSCVFCLEDSIKDCDIINAQKKLIEGFEYLNSKIGDGFSLPLIFIRVRNCEQIKLFEDNLKYITGFIFPKFQHTDLEYFNILEELNKKRANKIYCMPILESGTLLHRYSRSEELYKLIELLRKYRQYILNIRVGGTDLSGLCGLRRPVDMTIYDIMVVRDILSDIVSTFSCAEDAFVVSGPVWEYYAKDVEITSLKFDLNVNIKGLIKEAMLDKQNGFIGKTCIHPSQILPVQLSYSVGYNEYTDALQIVNASDGGVSGGQSNRMNEARPHKYWAEKIVKRAEIYGVLNQPECNYHTVKNILEMIFTRKE